MEQNEHYKELSDLVADGVIWKGHLNLTHTEENELKIKELFDCFPSYCICREGNNIPGKNPGAAPHYHFFCLLEASTLKLASFKKNIITMFPHLKRYVPPSGGSGGDHKYACGHPKKSNKDQYKNYLSDQEQMILEILYVTADWSKTNKSIKKNFNKTSIYKNLYYELKQLNIDRKTEIAKNNSKETTSYVRLLEQTLREKYTTKGVDGNPIFKAPELDAILEMVCQHFLKTRKTMNKSVIQNLTETLLNIFDENYYLSYKEKIKQYIQN